MQRGSHAPAAVVGRVKGLIVYVDMRRPLAHLIGVSKQWEGLLKRTWDRIM